MVFPIERWIPAGDCIQPLRRSGVGERRPAGDGAAPASMSEQAQLPAACREGDRLPGAARCCTDIASVTYCSQLCERAECERRGIQGEPPRTVPRAGPCRTARLAAPKAADSDPGAGFRQPPSARTLFAGDLR